MANVYDLKSKNVVIGTGAAVVGTDIGIGAVPAGKTRFITYVKAVNVNHGVGPTNTLYLGEYSAARVKLGTATTNKRLTIPFDAAVPDNTRHVPNGTPHVESSLFTISASQYLVGCTSRKPIDVFVQYYEG